METRHPVEGLFGSKFSAICNHCIVMSAWSRKTLKFCEKLLRFLEKRPLTVKCSKLFQKFSSRHRSTLLCSNVVKFVRREIGEIVHYLVDKNNNKISPASQTALLRALNLPVPVPDNVLRVLQILSKSVYFRRSYCRTHEHCQTAP